MAKKRKNLAPPSKNPNHATNTDAHCCITHRDVVKPTIGEVNGTRVDTKSFHMKIFLFETYRR